jgi:hypothetical protein
MHDDIWNVFNEWWRFTMKPMKKV